jgi:hypothetical protein
MPQAASEEASSKARAQACGSDFLDVSQVCTQVAYTTPAGARRIRQNGRFRKGRQHSHAHANGGEAASGRVGDPAV